jgi:hypothetical protein
LAALGALAAAVLGAIASALSGGSTAEAADTSGADKPDSGNQDEEKDPSMGSAIDWAQSDPQDMWSGLWNWLFGGGPAVIKPRPNPSNPGAMDQEIRRGGRGIPSDVTHVDPGHNAGQQPHVHFKDGSAMNRDGSPHHGNPNPSGNALKWLKRHGWPVSR